MPKKKTKNTESEEIKQDNEKLEIARNSKSSQEFIDALKKRGNHLSFSIPHQVQISENEQIDNADFVETIKESLYDVGAMPMAQTNEKRSKFRKELKEDKFLTKYIDKNVKNHYLHYLNDHFKALMIYSYHYMKVSKTL